MYHKIQCDGESENFTDFFENKQGPFLFKEKKNSFVAPRQYDLGPPRTHKRSPETISNNTYSNRRPIAWNRLHCDKRVVYLFLVFPTENPKEDAGHAARMHVRPGMMWATAICATHCRSMRPIFGLRFISHAKCVAGMHMLLAAVFIS